MAAREQHLAVGADLLPADDGVLGVDGLRAVALEPEDDGVRRAVADAGGAERAVELHAHARDPGERAALVEQGDEPVRRAHRTDRVRARRADPDGEEIEDADHTAYGRPASRVRRIGGTLGLPRRFSYTCRNGGPAPGGARRARGAAGPQPHRRRPRRRAARAQHPVGRRGPGPHRLDPPAPRQPGAAGVGGAPRRAGPERPGRRARQRRAGDVGAAVRAAAPRRPHDRLPVDAAHRRRAHRCGAADPRPRRRRAGRAAGRPRAGAGAGGRPARATSVRRRAGRGGRRARGARAGHRRGRGAARRGGRDG